MTETPAAAALIDAGLCPGPGRVTRAPTILPGDRGCSSGRANAARTSGSPSPSARPSTRSSSAADRSAHVPGEEKRQIIGLEGPRTHRPHGVRGHARRCAPAQENLEERRGHRDLQDQIHSCPPGRPDRPGPSGFRRRTTSSSTLGPQEGRGCSTRRLQRSPSVPTTPTATTVCQGSPASPARP